MPVDQLPPACRYCSTTELGMRPRAGSATLLSPAHSRNCRMSKSRFGLEPFVDGAALRRVERDDVELRRAALTYRASALRNAAAFFLLRSISYVAPSSPNVTVSAASPPSRSSNSFSITSRATDTHCPKLLRTRYGARLKLTRPPRTEQRAAWVGCEA